MEYQPETATPPEAEEHPSAHARLLPLYMTLAFIGTLAIGAILGFVARPLIVPDPVRVVEVAAPAASEAIAQANNDSRQPAVDEPGSTTAKSADDSPNNAVANPAAPTPSIMDFLLADARHSIGAEDAPVVIIEFSDFR